MLSTKTVVPEKSVQGEIQPEPKSAPLVMKRSVLPAATVPLDSSKSIGSCKAKTGKDDPKANEKQEKIQLQTENLTDTKLEPCNTKPVQTKNCEVKVEKLKMEDKETKSPDKAVDKTKESNALQFKRIPVAQKSVVQKPSNVAVPRKSPPISTPLLGERPLVLTTHLVPSLPISLFEVLVEAIEVAIRKPVVLLYEPRSDRKVATEVADIAILPASEDWEGSELLPVSFCFGHHLNKSNSPCIYADIIVAADSASHVEDITDLRGHRCSLPDRKKKFGATALLFNYLRTKGENPAFFGNTLDADTQVATLQMVAGKQAEVGILESPVIKCQKNLLPGIDSLHILTSLGPLPPYRIMAKKTLSDTLVDKITAYLLNIHKEEEWLDMFAPFGVKGFTKNFAELYELGDIKTAATSVPYY